jgi:hypothetical protein
MSYFRLTKKQCKKLSSISADFWWGDTDGSRRVHWISWEKMCQRKCEGGMGFRNYEVFNQALLAKQAWRILTDPTSLCARVLKARYFKNSDIMHAGCPGGGSFSWQSILHGRDLLKASLIWRIGNRASADIWTSNWILREGAQWPLGRKPDAPREVIKKVSELIGKEGQEWDEAKLAQYLYDFDVEDIKKSSIGGHEMEDCLAWNFTKNGVFSVRSAYDLQMSIRKQKEARSELSRSVQEHKGWLALWGANVPGK